MSRFTHRENGVTVSVADEKDARMGSVWQPAEGGDAKAEPQKSTRKSADKK